MLSRLEKIHLLELTKQLSFILDIESPRLVFHRNHHFATPTTLAVAHCSDSKHDIIYIDPSVNFTPPLFFIIGHEIKHIHQYHLMERDKILPDSYQLPSHLTVEDYNSQLAEIDANAFGLIVAEIFTHCTIQLPLSKELLKSIDIRKNELIKEFDL